MKSVHDHAVVYSPYYRFVAYFLGSSWDALLSLNVGVIVLGFDSSNHKASLFGQFTYSTSILPCLAWTILQSWVSPFEFILITLPTLNTFDVISGSNKKRKYYVANVWPILRD